MDAQGNNAYYAFRDGLIDQCEQLTWVRDIADASKHRGLGRPGEVTGVNNARVNNARSSILLGLSPAQSASTPLTIDLSDGSRHDLAEVLGAVIAFWNSRFG